jgi:hypothetical protein
MERVAMVNVSAMDERDGKMYSANAHSTDGRSMAGSGPTARSATRRALYKLGMVMS